jgi:hypothetical protein
VRSETRCLRELADLQKDLTFWKNRLEGETDLTKRKFLANTIIGVEERIETLKWILEGE